MLGCPWSTGLEVNWIEELDITVVKVCECIDPKGRSEDVGDVEGEETSLSEAEGW